jgi:hypothetical protein
MCDSGYKLALGFYLIKGQYYSILNSNSTSYY